MANLRLKEFFSERILVSRQSARAIEGALQESIGREVIEASAMSDASVVVDFEGIEGVSPGFLSELLKVIEAVLGLRSQWADRGIMITHVPTRLSPKFEAVARAHDMAIDVLADGTWRFVPRPAASS